MANDAGATALRVLIDTYRGLLKAAPAHRVDIVDRMGRHAALLVDLNGKWRPDGLHRTSAFLRDRLAQWVTATAFEPYRGLTAQEVADATALRWGLDRHPQEPASVVRLLQLDVSPDTLARWERRIVADASDASDAEPAHLLAAAARAATPTERPTWSTVPPDMWPPSTTGGPGVADERTGLIMQARASAPVLAPLPDEEVLRTLRAVTLDRLGEHFGAETEVNAFRHIAHRIAPRWQVEDAVLLAAPVPSPRGPSGGGAYVQAVAVAAQKIMYDVAADRRALLRDRASRVGLETFVRALPATGSLYTPLISDLEVALPAPLPDRLVIATVPGRPVATGMDKPGRAAGSLAYAAFLRAAPPEDKRDLAMNYIASRPARIADITSPDEAQEVALADHSVQWDLVTSESPWHAELLTRSMREHQVRWDGGDGRGSTGQREELFAHTFRAMVVLHNKHNISSRAYEYGVAGLQYLYRLEAELGVGAVAVAETAHQIELALAGVWVRLLERSFLKRGDWSTQHLGYARAALWWSAAADDRLRFLAREDVEGGLPSRRHLDGRISSTSWHVQTRLIRLRTLVAVGTAIESKLVERQRLLGEVRGPLAFPPPRDLDVDATEVANLCRHYRELVVRPEMTVGAHVDLVRTAVWLALLNRRNIPVVADLAPALKTLTFLDDDPASMPENAVIALDPRRLADWLRDQYVDLGVLSWLDRSTVVARFLDRRSEGAYHHLRELVDPYRPLQPSHD